jgi:CRP-like cAMP-binding protein
MSVTGRKCEGLVFAQLGPGDYFGEIAVVTGIEQAATVMSTSRMVIQRLSRDNYLRYLGQITEVQEQLSRSAARRAIDALHRQQSP